ncbi:MAG TPA: ribonuclease E/G [Acetobacteraceae bacterium]|nr:ribonuclease E/G [Acetobacteraceae bacterium]
MSVRILASASPGEVRVAAARGDRLLDYALWRPGRPDGVGDLYRGRVSARVPAMAGVFVALEGAEGFLPDSEGGKHLTEGTVLAVCVTRAAQGGKGPRLSAKLADADRRLGGSGSPALLRRGPGPVERFAAQYPEAPVLVDDAALLAELRPRLGERIRVAAEPLDDALENAIAELAEPEVILPNGARLAIHPTPALVAIDVDAGAAIAEQRGKAERHFAVNRAMLPDLAAQIRLRNLSGAILMDFAGLHVRQRGRLGPDLEAALAADPLRPRLLGFTALGLAEIVRPRVHPPLHELLVGPHATGLAALRAVARRAAAEPAWLPELRATPSVVRALQDDPVALEDLRRRTGRAVQLHADPGLTGR